MGMITLITYLTIGRQQLLIVNEMSKPTEAELIKMSRDPKFMYDRWQGRVKLGEEEVAKEKDRDKRERMEYMLKRQMEKRDEWKKKAGR